MTRASLYYSVGASYTNTLNKNLNLQLSKTWFRNFNISKFCFYFDIGYYPIVCL